MGCSNTTPLKPQDSMANAKLEIYGDYFSADTRVLLAICKMCELNFEFKLIDTLEQEQFKDEFKKINPNSSIPTIVRASQTILAAPE